MFHPGSNGELWRQPMVQHFIWNSHGGADAIKLKHLVTLMSLVGGQLLGPFRSWEPWGGQQVDAFTRGT